MAEDKKSAAKKPAAKQPAADPLLTGGTANTPGGGGGSTGGINLDVGGNTGPFDWDSASSSDIHSQSVPLFEPDQDLLGLGALFGNTKKNEPAQERTIGARVASVAKMSKEQQGELANILVDAGTLKESSTGYTVTGIQDALYDTLKQAGESGSRSLTDYVSKQTSAGEGAIGGGTTPAETQGDVNDLVDQFQSIASDYLVPTTSTGLAKLAQQYLDAGLDATQAEANYKATAQQQAAGLFPSLAPQINQGIDTKTLLDPYASLAEKTLGVDPTTIDWTTPMWSSALNSGGVDPATGRQSVATLSQFSQKLMSDPTYGYQYTQEAQNAAGSLTASILKLFGKLPDESFSTSLSGPTPDLAAT